MNDAVPIIDLSATPTEVPPRVIVAPELAGRQTVVIREPDETDDEYRSRCDLFALLRDHASTG